MTTDNRTNEQIVAEALRGRTIYGKRELNNQQCEDVAFIATVALRTADRLAVQPDTEAVEPSEAQVEAAAKALAQKDPGAEWDDFDEREFFMRRARAALVAAARATPQAECSETPGGRPCEASKPGHKLHWSNVPVAPQPSESDVREIVVERAFARWRDYEIDRTGTLPEGYEMFKAGWQRAVAAIRGEHDHIDDGSSYLDCAACEFATSSRVGLEALIDVLMKLPVCVRRDVTELADAILAAGFSRTAAPAERDAAIAAIGRVRAVAEDGVWRDTKTSGDWAWALDHMAHKILAALDGAPEPEVKP